MLPAVALGQEGTELPSRLRPPGTWPARGCTDPAPQAPRRAGRWCEEYLQSGKGSGEGKVPPGFGQRAHAQPGSGGGRLVRRVTVVRACPRRGARRGPGHGAEPQPGPVFGLLRAAPAPSEGSGRTKGRPRSALRPGRARQPRRSLGPAGAAADPLAAQRGARPRPRRRPAPPSPPPSVGKKPHQESIRGIFSRF